MRKFSAVVLFSLVSSLSHAGAFGSDVDVTSGNATTFGVGEGRSIKAVSKVDIFSWTDLKGGFSNKLEGLNVSYGSWPGNYCPPNSTPVPEPSTALLMIPAVLYLAFRRTVGKKAKR